MDIPKFLLAAVSVLVSFASCHSGESDDPASPVARIMPLGVPITASSAGLPSYRYFLWHLLTDQGYRIDFVGTLHGVSDGLPAHSDFDMDHEGHPGWRADEVLAQIRGWATATSPDVVLIHLGHNDLCQGQGIQGTVEEIAAIVDELRTVNAAVKIVVAQVIASSAPCHSQIASFNMQLPTLVSTRSTASSPVVLVDQHTGFEPATMTVDGTHPNVAGDSRMASRWFEKLAPLLRKIS